MFIATVQSNDRSKPHRGGMDCPTQPGAALTGLGNILVDIVGYKHVAPMGLGNIRMDIVGYKHATPTGFGISRRAIPAVYRSSWNAGAIITSNPRARS